MKKMVLRSIRNDYNKDVDKKRDFEKIKKFFDDERKK